MIITINVIKILVLSALATAIAVFWAPVLTNFLYKHKLWRKTARTKTIDNKPAPVFYRLHKEKEVGTPRMGGLLIWVTTGFIILLFALLAQLSNNEVLQKLNFLSRGQTWLPLATLISAAILGLSDDVLQVFSKGKYSGGGVRFTRRLFVVFIIGLIGALWFYFKLDWHTLHIPGNGELEIGIFYIPLFIITMIASWAGGIIDGIDGLSGGAFSIMFGAFAIIAFSNGQYDLATFCGVIAGATLAFLWFNIPPARFYMGETGTIALTSTLAVVAFLTDSLLVFPIIAGLLVIEAGSAILQILSKRIFHRKIFLCAPVHHHLEAKGWAREKIVMRFWIIGIGLATIGVAIRLLG